VADTADDNV